MILQAGLVDNYPHISPKFGRNRYLYPTLEEEGEKKKKLTGFVGAIFTNHRSCFVTDDLSEAASLSKFVFLKAFFEKFVIKNFCFMTLLGIKLKSLKIWSHTKI